MSYYRSIEYDNVDNFHDRYSESSRPAAMFVCFYVLCWTSIAKELYSCVELTQLSGEIVVSTADHTGFPFIRSLRTSIYKN